MSKITITIHTDNAAFHADPELTGQPNPLAMGDEVARILRHMAEQFESDGQAYNPRDINGNTVGTVETIE